MMNDETRRKVGNFVIGVVAFVVVALAVVVLLWLDGVWPDKLIPFLPFERV